jgi:transposase-like protein
MAVPKCRAVIEHLEVVESGRRRHWTEDEKLRIVTESLSGSRLVSSTARRYGISRSLLTTWRRQFRIRRRPDGEAGTAFVPAVVLPESAVRVIPAGRRAPAEAARTGERAAEEAGGGPRSRDRGDEGDRCKKMVGVPARREQVAYARRRGLSQRRSCTLLGVARSALGYRSVRAAKDGPVLARMAALGAQYPRFGYRRIRIFLEREGHGMSWGRAWRLWRRARLQVPRRRPRKRIASGRPRPQSPTGANQVWSYDFVFDWRRAWRGTPASFTAGLARRCP